MTGRRHCGFQVRRAAPWWHAPHARRAAALLRLRRTIAIVSTHSKRAAGCGQIMPASILRRRP